MLRLNLERRIAVVFLGLLISIMLLMLLLVQRSSDQIISAEAQRQLTAGRSNFEALVEGNRRQLELAARVLSGDFSFREAIATRDRPTMVSVLGNHGNRIGAQIMMALSPDGHIIATTKLSRQPMDASALTRLVSAAEISGRSSDFVPMTDGRLYQMVVVPIMAPTRLAWIVMGFPVNDEWARELAKSSGLEVSLINTTNRRLLASSLPMTQNTDLMHSPHSLHQPRLISLGKHAYHALSLPLGKDAQAVLLHSTSKSQDIFRELNRAMILTALGGILLFTLGSFWLARRIALPVNALANVAQHIADGDYTFPVTVKSRDEIGRLANTFEKMRQGIASREQKITRLAYHDELTGLPNRVQIEQRMNMLGDDAKAAVFVLDLDRFTLINDALGHAVGDQLLQQVSARLSSIVHENQLLARLWGDEFLFLIQDMDASAANAFAQSLLAALHAPIEVGGQRLDVSGSIGIALRPHDGTNLNSLLQRAELAMAQAKHRQCGFMLASELGPTPSPANLSLIGEMRQALANQEFVLHYQPKRDLESGRIIGAEALLRWQHPERGLVPPGLFIPFAEQTGFIREITPWLLAEVAKQTASWHAQGHPLTISANLSARDLLDPGLVVLVQFLLKKHQLPPAALCLEITESALMEDPALAQAHLTKLAQYGVKLSIDDYGAGQASLAYLKSLPVHELKIDQSFIRHLDGSPKDAAIVHSTITLGHALNLEVVAEGIETESTMNWLAEVGCDTGQGYFIAKPMPASAFVTWLAPVPA